MRPMGWTCFLSGRYRVVGSGGLGVQGLHLWEFGQRRVFLAVLLGTRGTTASKEGTLRRAKEGLGS